MTPEPDCQTSREEDQERSNAQNADFWAHAALDPGTEEPES